MDPEICYKEFQGHVLEHKAATPGVEDYVREVLVAVTGNTDDGGDVINPGAFNFKRNPKIVWSHDLKALVAKVLEYEEWTPGDVRLPADLIAKGLGALWFKIEFDPLDPESFKAFRKVVFHKDLGWSIGYEVDPKGFKMLPDGRRALTKIYVWEGSPTSFGMNQEARTLSVKSVVDSLDLPEEKAKALLQLMGTLAGPSEAKSWPPLEDSYEDLISDVREAAQAWATAVYGAPADDNYWWLCVDGTFPDHVVISVTDNTDTTSYQFPYTMTTDGEDVVLGDPTEVEVITSAEVVPVETTPDVGAPDAGLLSALTAALNMGKSLDVAFAEVVDMEAKAGRVLSEANLSKLRSAMETIAGVLDAATKKGDYTGPKRTVKPKPPKVPAGGKAADETAAQLQAKTLLELEALLES